MTPTPRAMGDELLADTDTTIAKLLEEVGLAPEYSPHVGLRREIVSAVVDVLRKWRIAARASGAPLIEAPLPSERMRDLAKCFRIPGVRWTDPSGNIFTSDEVRQIIDAYLSLAPHSPSADDPELAAIRERDAETYTLASMTTREVIECRDDRRTLLALVSRLTGELQAARCNHAWLRLADENGERHDDDDCVERFTWAMREKMAKKRAEGCDGWHDPDCCSVQHLANMLVEHLEKGDPVDIGNFAMMLYHRAIGADVDRDGIAGVMRKALSYANSDLIAARDAALADAQQLRAELTNARRNAYIRGFQRGYDKKAELRGGISTYEQVRIWAEAHAISYCDQFDDAALSSSAAKDAEKEG